MTTVVCNLIQVLLIFHQDSIRHVYIRYYQICRHFKYLACLPHLHYRAIAFAFDASLTTFHNPVCPLSDDVGTTRAVSTRRGRWAAPTSRSWPAAFSRSPRPWRGRSTRCPRGAQTAKTSRPTRTRSVAALAARQSAVVHLRYLATASFYHL